MRDHRSAGALRTSVRRHQCARRRWHGKPWHRVRGTANLDEYVIDQVHAARIPRGLLPALVNYYLLAQ